MLNGTSSPEVWWLAYKTERAVGALEMVLALVKIIYSYSKEKETSKLDEEKEG